MILSVFKQTGRAYDSSCNVYHCFTYERPFPTDPALYGCDATRSIVFEIVSRTARLMVLVSEDLSYFNLSIIYRDFSSLKKGVFDDKPYP